NHRSLKMGKISLLFKLLTNYVTDSGYHKENVFIQNYLSKYAEDGRIQCETGCWNFLYLELDNSSSF
ncbi:hypothetical protein, partial [Siminovitchia fortis]